MTNSFPLTLQNYADVNFNGYGYFCACLCWTGQGSASELTSWRSTWCWAQCCTWPFPTRASCWSPTSKAFRDLRYTSSSSWLSTQRETCTSLLDPWSFNDYGHHFARLCWTGQGSASELTPLSTCCWPSLVARKTVEPAVEQLATCLSLGARETVEPAVEKSWSYHTELRVARRSCVASAKRSPGPSGPRDFNGYGYCYAPPVLDRARSLGYHREEVRAGERSVAHGCWEEHLVDLRSVGLLRPAILLFTLHVFPWSQRLRRLRIQLRPLCWTGLLVPTWWRCTCCWTQCCARLMHWRKHVLTDNPGRSFMTCDTPLSLLQDAFFGGVPCTRVHRHRAPPSLLHLTSLPAKSRCQLWLGCVICFFRWTRSLLLCTWCHSCWIIPSRIMLVTIMMILQCSYFWRCLQLILSFTAVHPDCDDYLFHRPWRLSWHTHVLPRVLCCHSFLVLVQPACLLEHGAHGKRSGRYLLLVEVFPQEWTRSISELEQLRKWRWINSPQCCSDRVDRESAQYEASEIHAYRE